MCLGFISLESGQDPFYPASLRQRRASQKELLAHYATKLGTIEMTSVNYRIPSQEMTQQWADSVPSGFLLHMKLFGLFSFGNCPRAALPPSAMEKMRSQIDPVQLRSLPLDVVDEVWRCFRAALAPLQAENKLGMVMSQFTASFVPCADSFEHAWQQSSEVHSGRHRKRRKASYPNFVLFAFALTTMEATTRITISVI